MRRNALIFVIVGLAFGAMAAFYLTQTHVPAPSATTSTDTNKEVSTGKALIGGPFSLIDQTGKRVTDKDFHGKTMLVFFGFTHCPDICPSGLQVMTAGLEALGDAAKDVIPVFITLDPERDTPQMLAEYVRSFHPRLMALTGTKEDVTAAAKAYRVYYQKVPSETAPNDYTIDHSAIFYIIDANGTYKSHIPHTTNVDEFIKDLKKAL